MYQPVSGNIIAEFSDSTHLSGSLRPYIGLVPADNLIYCDSIEANICMALEINEKQLHQAAAMANIDQYIESLDQKYKTIIGGGELALSSGQSQRIAIARTIYQGSEILLFDEPTANLDTESISVFLQMLVKISKNRICIVVTHDSRVSEQCNVLFEMKESGLIPIQS